jgi:hypothetical protein
VIGQDRQILVLDDGTFSSGRKGFLPIVPFSVHMINTERHYHCGDYDGDVDIGTKDWLIRAPVSGLVHFLFEITASKNGLIEFFEAPTTTANGTGITSFNNDRNSSNTATLLAFKDPTVTGTGTLMASFVVGSDGATPNGDRGGENDIRKHFILKQSEDYLVRFTALTDDTRVSLELEFWETD